MARKNPHYLKAVINQSFPRRVIVFKIDWIADSEDDNRAAKMCRLNQWTLTTYDNDAGTFRQVDKIWGLTAATFWDRVKLSLLPKSQTWLIGFNVAFQMGLLGFWDLLEESKWLLADTDPLSIYADGSPSPPKCESDSDEAKPATQGGERKASGGFRGFCVIEDPPTIIVCRPAFSPGVVKIVDVKNWGVKVQPPALDGEGECDAIGRFVCGWINTLSANMLGGLKATAASQAMAAYRGNYMSSPIMVHDNAAALTLERDSLYCGRNECFRLGVVNGPVYHLDVNSFYPSVAACASVPCRLAGYGPIDTAGIETIRARGFSVIADVHLETSEPWFPKRRGDSLIFPIGTFRTTLAGPELYEALDSGCVFKTHSAAWYEHDQLFSKWVDNLFFMRQEAVKRGDVPSADCVKSLMVSVFGKFAQWDWKWVDMPQVEPLCPYGLWWQMRPEMFTPRTMPDLREPEPWESPAGESADYCRWRSVGWNVQHESVKQEHRESVPCIPAWIYSAARMRLLEVIKTAKWENVFYTDADSIWTNAAGNRRLDAAGMLHDTELGKLKCKAVHDRVKFLGLKHYELPDSTVHAGIPEHANRISSGHYEYQSSERLHAALLQYRSPLAHLRIKAANYDGPYRHGKVDMAGRVRPITLMEL